MRRVFDDTAGGAMSGTVRAVPLELKEANAFVQQRHRHHAPVIRDKYRLGAAVGSVLAGVVQVGVVFTVSFMSLILHFSKVK